MEINKKLRLKEELNKKYFLENPTDDIQYPHLDDTQLQKEVACVGGTCEIVSI
jgi:hypothetical protein